MQFLSLRHFHSLVIIALVSACGGGGGNSNSGFVGSGAVTNNNPVSDGVFRVAVASSPYSSQIVGCIANENTNNNCRLSTLPFIGQKVDVPTKVDILAQTIVSHPWMAQRFEQLLDKMPQDIFLLFRGVTGVVIGADIRPSHYNPGTGAIYLDPADLWLLASERATISKVADYRSGYSDGLRFRSLWRYVQGNKDAFVYYSLDSTVQSRLITDIVNPMADLLFHELAHANDFMPPANLAQINSQLTAARAIDATNSDRISTGLKNSMPLNSQMLSGLAQVMYRGATATNTQKQLSAEQVGLDFAIDGASDTYAYSTQYEDAAMLFGEVMMKYHFNVDREIAFTDAPPATGATCANFIVRWGVRNRIGEPLVKTRAQSIVQNILGKNDTTIYFAALPAPRSMLKGVDWCNNLVSTNNRENVMQKMSQEPIPERNLLPVD